MLDPRPRTQFRRRLVPAVLVALSAAIAVCAPLAAATTVEFHSTAPVRGIDLGLPQPKLGVTGTVKFHTSAADKRALTAAKKSEELLDEATARTDAAAKADRRIAAIEQLLNEVQDDQARLSTIISARLAEQYKEGDDADLRFLLNGDGLSDLITRGKVLGAQADQDRRTIDEYEITVAKVEQYKAVLEELRDINGDQARSLQDRAARLDQVLVAAKVGHDEAPPETGKNAPKGVKGSWYVMDGAFTAQLFMPTGGSGYDGGETRFPARRATPVQIQMVLGDKRIDLDASGYQDVLTGQIDGRLLDAMVAAAQQFGYIKISSLKSDHGVYTAGGNVSEHSYGCAMDIGTIGSTYITPGAQTPGGEVNQAVLFFSGLGVATGKPDLAPHQVISLFDLGGATLAMGDHGDHIHVGYSC
ncbi:MAG: Lytic transglycosylase catalytic [Thermoleophilia bacterium]|nr:Lytic transglycosylase catalytic [Thermoleophilia bacterium]